MNRTLESTRESTFEVAIELARLDRRLAQIVESLQLPVDCDDLFEDRLPATPSTQLYGVISGVKDELKEMIRVLLESAQISESSLRHEFLHRRRKASSSCQEAS